MVKVVDGLNVLGGKFCKNLIIVGGLSTFFSSFEKKAENTRYVPKICYFKAPNSTLLAKIPSSAELLQIVILLHENFLQT